MVNTIPICLGGGFCADAITIHDIGWYSVIFCSIKLPSSSKSSHKKKAAELRYSNKKRLYLQLDYHVSTEYQPKTSSCKRYHETAHAVWSMVKSNLFVKPNEQSETSFGFAVARKGA